MFRILDWTKKSSFGAAFVFGWWPRSQHLLVGAICSPSLTATYDETNISASNWNADNKIYDSWGSFPAHLLRIWTPCRPSSVVPQLIHNLGEFRSPPSTWGMLPGLVCTRRREEIVPYHMRDLFDVRWLDQNCHDLRRWKETARRKMLNVHWFIVNYDLWLSD